MTVQKLTMTPKAISVPQPVLEKLVEALALMRYGELRLTVHDGRVVQLETSEKIRFQA